MSQNAHRMGGRFVTHFGFGDRNALTQLVLRDLIDLTQVGFRPMSFFSCLGGPLKSGRVKSRAGRKRELEMVFQHVEHLSGRLYRAFDDTAVPITNLKLTVEQRAPISFVSPSGQDVLFESRLRVAAREPIAKFSIDQRCRFSRELVDVEPLFADLCLVYDDVLRGDARNTRGWSNDESPLLE